MVQTSRKAAATWQDYARLGRLELVGLSLGPLYGALSVQGAQLPASQAAVLFVINFSIIVGGTIHNDLLDLPFDRRSPVVAERPLASRLVSRRQAWSLVGACVFAIAILVGIFFPSPLTIAVSTLIVGFAALYNHLGKRFEGGDLIYALTMMLICLFGAVAVLPPGKGLASLPAITWVVLAAIFANQYFFNAAPGGLKDLGNDRLNGVRTLAVRFSRGGPDGIAISPTFKILVLGIRLAAIAICFIPFVFLGHTNYNQAGLLGGTGVMMLIMAIRLVNTPRLNREEIGKYSTLGESFAILSFCFLLMDLAGLRWTLFMFAAPFAWFFTFNFLIHGQTTRLPRTF